jgi:hypothetical protein
VLALEHRDALGERVVADVAQAGQGLQAGVGERGGGEASSQAATAASVWPWRWRARPRK